MKPRDLALDLAQRLEAVANPDRQRGAQAYMKTSDPFFGVDAASMRRVVKGMAKSHPPENQAEYLAQIQAFWSLPQREAHYAAVEWAKLFPAFQTLEALPLFERMIREGAWWDTVDEVARFLVGALLLKERAVMKPVMERWIQDEHLWIRRAALVAHQKHRERADEAQLFDHCLRLAPEQDFFIRKAIGWALREHSKTRPEAVEAFIAAHRAELSGLSIREGLKRVSASR
ncbi:MAG: DNA alkylation repair protein [Holophagaceae bacterium]|nr:DNA alkylation repair protein [Holophagaceae bacterium]